MNTTLLFDQAILRSPHPSMDFTQVMMQEQKLEENITFTENGALTHQSSFDSLVDLFYKSIRNVDEKRILDIFERAFQESPLYTAKMIAYIRDIRGGKGERDLGRLLMEELGKKDRELLQRNMKHYLGVYGRWDDGVDIEDNELLDMYLHEMKEQLEQDKRELDEKGEDAHISLCAKWVPTEGKSVDKKKGIYRKLTKKMGIRNEVFRKEYLVPLRKQLNLVETNLVNRNYENIDYEKVPSRAMYIYGKEKTRKGLKGAFLRNDEERFGSYMVALKSGEKKVNASTLYPHEVMKTYFDGNSIKTNTVNELTEAQWRVMEEKTRALGKIGKTIVMSDVSGSMSGTPMLISIALGILISSCCEEESFRDYVLTFSAQPQFHKIQGDNLLGKIQSLRVANWGQNTNFYKAFEVILERAVKNQIPQEKMPERMMVISDMQFDVATDNRRTNFEEIDRLYEAKGYKRPQIIFWNVAGRMDEVPVTANTVDTALISGFSIEIMKAVLEGKTITPRDIMLCAILNARYDLIV
jgi:hypothetical protein